MPKPLRVGVVGASLQRGWANMSHLPALKGIIGVELGGVTARTQKEADDAAAKFGAARGFAGVDSMIGDSAIDLITIAVRVPSHRELVLKALAAGKHVYCEWPLGRDVQESEQLRDAAIKSGLRVAIGLQARKNPALLKARDLLSAGAVGRILSARMYSGTIAFGPREGEADSYLEDAQNGATHLTIHGGHAMDTVIALLGSLDTLDALGTTQYKQIDIGEGARTLERTIPDHLLFQARTRHSSGVGVEVDGGKSPENSRFRFEITGEQGTMTLQGGSPVGFQGGRLALSINGKTEDIDEGEISQLPEFAANVGSMYAALRDDIASGQRTVPDFDHAVRLTRLLTDAAKSSASGKRSQAAEWPES